MKYFQNIAWAAVLIGLQALTVSAADEYVKLPINNDVHWTRVASYIEETPQSDYHQAPESAREAFRDMKFGVRIHWGLYTVAGTGESWPFLKFSNEERQRYQQLYLQFNPTNFNADDWMDLFKTNGVKVFAMTTKHHEGFSMFDTHTRVKQRVNWTAPGGPKLEDCDVAYSIMDTPFHRDIIKELCDAAHRHGVKIDLYFSHPDWYDADFRPYAYHPVQVPDGDRYGVLPADLKAIRNPLVVADPTPAEVERMMARHRAQLTELLTHYGQIDMMCLDQWFGPPVWPQLRDTIKSLRHIQPDVMLRARGIGNYGDYYTPEGFIPGDKANTAMPWMVIHPLAGRWSYDPVVAHYHGGAWIVSNLVDVVAKGGNFMVGFGPDATGRFHPKAIEALQYAGAWLKINGEAIFNTRPRDGDLWKDGHDIRYTRTKDRKYIYAIALKWPGDKIVLSSVRARPGTEVTMLGATNELEWHNDANAGLEIDLPASWQTPANRPSRQAFAFRIEGDDRSRKTMGSGSIQPAFPGVKSDWHGFDCYDFQLFGYQAQITVPKHPMPGHPWVWVDASTNTEAALLTNGFYLARLNVPDAFGSPDAVKLWDNFYSWITTRYGFAKMVALVGISRGGLYCYNWAIANPDKVACIYGDAPVCDFKSWPGGKLKGLGKGTGNAGEWKKLLLAYRFKSDAEAIAYRGNPVDNLEPLAHSHVPLLHVYGDADTAVPWDENTARVAERYQKLGGSITLICKHGAGHHPHGLADPTLIVAFIKEHAGEAR